MQGNNTVLIFSDFQMEIYINTTLEFSWSWASTERKIPIRTTLMGEELVWEARITANLSGRAKTKMLYFV
jgi:hypothetical protein